MPANSERKRSCLERVTILLALSFILPLIGQAQTDYPLRIRGAANLTTTYTDGILAVEFQPAAHKADAGLQPGEGSWLDRALNGNEPHVLKQNLSPDEAQFVATYLRNPDHYATFYCSNTSQGYFQSATSEPFTPPRFAASPNPSPAAVTAATPATNTEKETGGLPAFGNAEVDAFIEKYEQFASDYLAAIKAMNSGDDIKIQAMADRSADMLDTIPKMAALLKPDEKQKYEAYLNGWKEKLEAATKQ
jgi:hypothetical protein